MWGAIIGDLAGSVYEYGQYKKVSTIEVDKLITEDSFFTDDTILTVAIYDAIRSKGEYRDFLKEYGKRYINYEPVTSIQHFKKPFGEKFVMWLNGSLEGKSIGNGAMMRISGIGNIFDTEEDVSNQAILATKPSHNSLESIYCARTVALFILYARKGFNKHEIFKKFSKTSIEYKPFTKFNKTCIETLNNCLYAIQDSLNFEDAIRKVISYGGDTDTNAAIVGAMAEALYGIPEYLVSKAREKIPSHFSYIIDDAYDRKIRYRNLKR